MLERFPHLLFLFSAILVRPICLFPFFCLAKVLLEERLRLSFFTTEEGPVKDDLGFFYSFSWSSFLRVPRTCDR